jgi:hypothetical protein
VNCETYCSHGGVCELEAGHAGQHDSRYCQWSDTESIGRDEANRHLADMPGGQDMVAIWEEIVP